jgi:hypothetical protein
VLWGESWACLLMKLSDKPRYSYKDKIKKLRTKEEVMKHLGKYARKP